MNSLHKQRHSQWQKVSLGSFLLLFLVLGLLSNSSWAATLGEEFIATGNFEKGSIVSLNQANPKDIELSTLSNNKYTLGVVNNSGDNLITYSRANSDVTVSLSGEVQVFVTDANGTINKGDFIGASWLEGVGMKADSRDKQHLLGVALENFNSDNSAKDYGSIQTPDGSKHVKVDTILIRIFDKDTTGTVATKNTDSLEGLIRSIAGREVSFAKAVTVSLIFLTSIVASGMFVTSSIKGSFVSLGRNPRASRSIYKGLLHVTTIAIIVIMIGTTLSYVVLVI